MPPLPLLLDDVFSVRMIELVAVLLILVLILVSFSLPLLPGAVFLVLTSVFEFGAAVAVSATVENERVLY